MLTENVKEYELISAELHSIRNCITSYISYLIGSSGIGVCIISYFKTLQISHSLSLFITVSTTLVISAMHYILIYKYNSHNRYAGYLRLISQEISLASIKKKNGREQKKIEHLICWELCVSMLNNASKRKGFPEKYWRDILKFRMAQNGMVLSFKNDPEKIKKVLVSKWNDLNFACPRIDKHAFWRGISLLISGIIKRDNSKSWKYPLYTSYVVIIFNLYYLALSGYCFWAYTTSTTLAELSYVIVTGYFVILAVILTIWQRNVVEMYRLMLGSKTVDAFCWKFLQYRIEAVNQYGLVPTYHLTSKKRVWLRRNEVAA